MIGEIMNKELVKPIYLVHWNDAWSTQSYYSKGNDYTSYKSCSIGFMVEENDDTIVISQTSGEDKQERNLLIIPWEYIESIEQLI